MNMHYFVNHESKGRIRFLIAILFYLLASLSTSAAAQSSGIHIHLTNASFEELFKEIEKKSSYTFLYKTEMIQSKSKRNFQFSNRPVREILDQVLKPEGLTYTIDDNVIIVKLDEQLQRKPETGGSREIKGRVLDNEGIPLIGAGVMLTGNTAIGVATDIDGLFTLKIPAAIERPVLRFTYVGMKTIERAVSDNMEIQMEPLSTVLEEVIIESGYGLVQKRSDMVGSAFQVDSKQIENLPAARIDNMLEGLVPGLVIGFNSDSDANTRPRFSTRIRGEGSLTASSEPIWIVDGVRMYTGGNTNLITGVESAISPLSYLNPDDIESMTVLRDASAVSLYGADGSNGVILVTTKKGGSAKPIFNVSLNSGISHVNNSLKFKVLDAQQYMTLAKESYLNRYAATDPDMLFFPFQNVSNNSYSATNTDWYDVFYDTGYYTQLNLSFMGGTDKVRNYFSTSYYDGESTVIGNNQQRFSVRLNTDVQLHRRIKFSLKSGFSYNINTIFSPGSNYYEFLPIFSPYNDDGSFRLYNRYYTQDSNGEAVIKDYRFFNSVAEREENDFIQRAFANNTSASLSFDLMDGLSLTTQFGLDFQSVLEHRYNAMSNWSGRNTLDGGKEVGYAYRNNANTLSWNMVERLNYNKVFGDHAVGALIGFEAMSRENRNVSASGNTFVNDYIKEVSYAVNRNGSSSQNIHHSASFIGQANYSYDNRYFLTVNSRRDGNSDFGEDVRWAQFGSAGVAWNIHNESFFKSEAINQLKLKASYGTAGNSRLGGIQARGTYTYGNSYNGQPASVMGSIRNKTLSWETSYITNVGASLRLLDRVSVELEVYTKRTEDMLSNTAISFTTGQSAIDTNIGSMRNNGVELNIESENIKTDNFSWFTSLNMAHTSNKILTLNVARLGSSNIVWREGYDKNTLNIVRWAGVNPRNGEPLWYDSNGNITNVYSSNNAVPYKSTIPDLTGGISSNLRYRSFSFQILMSYVIGGYSFSSFSRNVNSDGLNIMNQNQSINQMDRWQKPGDIALSPKPYWGLSTYSTMNSTRYLYNTTHLKLKNIVLGYSIPKSFLNRWGINSGEVSLIVDNIAIITQNYSKLNSYRQSMSGYPLETTYSMSLSMSF